MRHPGAIKKTIRLAALLLLWIPAARLAGETLVVNPGVEYSDIARGTARSFFYMRLREWPDGTPVRVFVLPDNHSLHVAFAKEVLNVFPYRLRRAWDRAVFAGLGQAPQQVDNVEQMRARVAETPGAIGYLPEDKIDETVRPLDIE